MAGIAECGASRMLKLSRALFLERPDAEVLDYYERATVNHILSSVHPTPEDGTVPTG
ncbi:beta-L-arabinofuranosidase domain-containing protein [Streptomyces sp. NPDC001165]|uniref:beta-L-arabinofuranosidase domain-containing protein n=1 Tax=Streptomyces sp. NPDC001165 TaxID=3364546 RepID=UPI003679CFE4